MGMPEFGWKLGRYRLHSTRFTRAVTQGTIFDPKLKIGLNEAAIGIQMPEFGWKLGRYRLHSTRFTRAVTQGTIFDPVGAIEVGFLDELVEGDCLTAAMTEACRLGKYLHLPT